MANPVDAKLKKGLNSHHIVVIGKTNICTTVLQKETESKKKKRR